MRYLAVPATIPPLSSADPTDNAAAQLPDDPGQEMLPIAQPEPAPAAGVPVQLDADRQTHVGDVFTLDGHVVVHYRDYILRADKVVYHQSTSELEADGHLQISGGPNGVLINATHGDMRLNMHTARFYNVSGSQGIHSRRPLRRLLHLHSLPVYRPGRPPDRRRQLPPHRRHHDQLPPSQA